MRPGRRFAEFLSRLRRGSDDRDRARLAAILELNRALAQAEDRRTLLQLLLDEAIALFAAERGFVVLADADADGRRGQGRDEGRDEGRGEGHGGERGGSSASFRVELARSLDKEPVQRAAQKISSTVVRRCLRTRQGVFTEDAQADDLAASQSVADLKLRSVLCVPLLADDRCLGCVYLDHRFRSSAFAAQDLPWLEAFADQAAIALHLHELLEQSRERSREIERQNRELAARVVEQEQALGELREEVSRDALEHRYPEILGEAPALLRCLHLLDRVIDGDFPVLLCGESGCGKELAARAIHRAGRRSRGPFVPIHVASINPQLLESELFGHVRGAFTGASRDRKGLLREADGGVVFLDEVTEMPLDTQVTLLRFLEEHRVRPVGGDASIAVDVRVVAATNRDVRAAVDAGRLREDLYYRLAVVTVPLPALRERRGDIPQLVEHFLQRAAADSGQPAARPKTASPALLAALGRRGWPGNVRQLRNEVLRADAMATGDTIETEHLGPDDAPSGTADTLELAELERRAIEAALQRSGGNKSEAARLLGISRRALYNKLDR